MGGIALSSCFSSLPPSFLFSSGHVTLSQSFFKEPAFAASIKETLNDPPADPLQREDGSSCLKRPPTHKVNNLTQFNLSPNVT